MLPNSTEAGGEEATISGTSPHLIEPYKKIIRSLQPKYGLNKARALDPVRPWITVPPYRRTREDLAFVGFAATTRNLAPYQNPSVEIWGLNEAHRQPWMRRWTRWFQIHEKWDYTKQEGKAYKEHWEWLKQKHPFPIYMQEIDPEVPSSVAFPLDEVCQTFLAQAHRGNEQIKFFTSSYSYQMALALLLGFDHIGSFGYEMATDTEYRYQRESTSFWIGLAMGLGKNIYLPPGCRILRGELYGYEVSRMINRQRLEFLLKKHEYMKDMHMQRLQQIGGARLEVEKLARKARGDEKKILRTRIRELHEQEMNQMGVVNDHGGQVKMLESLIKTVDNMYADKNPDDGYRGPMSDQEATELVETLAKKDRTVPTATILRGLA